MAGVEAAVFALLDAAVVGKAQGLVRRPDSSLSQQPTNFAAGVAGAAWATPERRSGDQPEPPGLIVLGTCLISAESELGSIS